MKQRAPEREVLTEPTSVEEVKASLCAHDVCGDAENPERDFTCLLHRDQSLLRAG